MNYRMIFKTGIVSLIMIFAISCETLKEINLYSPSDDAKLGKQLNEEIKKNPKEYPVYRNTYATNYVQNMLNEIVKSPLIKYRKQFAYKVTLIDNDKVVNAFATPGGYIYVYTGLLKLLDNEATLAAIIAHEIAHAERRHSTKRMTKAYGLQMAADIALGKESGKTAEVAANLFSGLALLENSRDDEYEADEYSFKYLKSTGKWYPGGIVYFFDKVSSGSKGGGSDAFKTLLSTHPLGPDRVKAVNELMKKNNVPPPTEKNLKRRPYLEFKKRLD